MSIERLTFDQYDFLSCYIVHVFEGCCSHANQTARTSSKSKAQLSHHYHASELLGTSTYTSEVEHFYFVLNNLCLFDSTWTSGTNQGIQTHSMPTTLSTSANNNQNIYPSANAVLLNNDNSAYAPPATATAVAATSGKEASFRDQYASAHVVGTDISPFSTRLVHATETHATATALDPWSKQKTVAAETQEQGRNQAPTFVYHPPSSDYTSPNEYGNNDDNNDNGTAVLPAAALEDPMHKKYRRRIRRRGRMIAFGAAGFVVGSIVLGPFGAVALGIGGASAAKAASKAGERRKDKRVRKKILRMQQQRDQGNLERIVISRR